MQQLWRAQTRVALTSHDNKGVQIRFGPADVLVVGELVGNGAVARLVSVCRVVVT